MEMKGSALRKDRSSQHIYFPFRLYCGLKQLMRPSSLIVCSHSSPVALLVLPFKKHALPICQCFSSLNVCFSDHPHCAPHSNQLAGMVEKQLWILNEMEFFFFFFPDAALKKN